MKLRPKDKVKVLAIGPWHNKEGYVISYVQELPHMVGKCVMGTVSSYSIQLRDNLILTFAETELERV